jgi:hypothetical protein
MKPKPEKRLVADQATQAAAEKARLLAEAAAKRAQTAKTDFKMAKRTWKLARKGAKRTAKEARRLQKKLARYASVLNKSKRRGPTMKVLPPARRPRRRPVTRHAAANPAPASVVALPITAPHAAD